MEQAKKPDAAVHLISKLTDK